MNKAKLACSESRAGLRASNAAALRQSAAPHQRRRILPAIASRTAASAKDRRQKLALSTTRTAVAWPQNTASKDKHP